MDVNKILAELRQEHAQIQEVIASLEVLALTRQRRQRLRVPQRVNGVVVMAIDEDSRFADLDLLPGVAKAHRHVGTGGMQLKRPRA